MAREAKNHLKPQNLTGISQEQIEPHFEAHYKGYVKKLQEIEDKLKDHDFSPRSKANQNYSEFRELKVEETFNYQGVILHELYFSLLKKSGQPSESFQKACEKHFGSLEKALEELKAVALCFRGWAILGWDIFEERLLTNGLDAHNQYSLTGLLPLIVIDTYEHAYYVDYKNKRAPYLDAFFDNLNWDLVNDRFEKIQKAQEALRGFLA